MPTSDPFKSLESLQAEEQRAERALKRAERLRASEYKALLRKYRALVSVPSDIPSELRREYIYYAERFAERIATSERTTQRKRERRRESLPPDRICPICKRGPLLHIRQWCTTIFPVRCRACSARLGRAALRRELPGTGEPLALGFLPIARVCPMCHSLVEYNTKHWRIVNKRCLCMQCAEQQTKIP